MDVVLELGVDGLTGSRITRPVLDHPFDVPFRLALRLVRVVSGREVLGVFALGVEATGLNEEFNIFKSEFGSGFGKDISVEPTIKFRRVGVSQNTPPRWPPFSHIGETTPAAFGKGEDFFCEEV